MMPDDETHISTHAKWAAARADNLRRAIAENAPDVLTHYENLAHVIVESRPYALRQFVENIDLEDCVGFGKLIALAWRVVGNEYRDDQKLVERAYRSIYQLCDGVQEATESFAKDL